MHAQVVAMLDVAGVHNADVVTDWANAELLNLSTGTLPQAWSGMSQLRHLSISSNKIAETLPPAWGQLGAFPELAILYLDGNSLTGEHAIGA